MKVTKEYFEDHISSDDEDEFGGECYRYWLYRFEGEREAFVVRHYTDEAHVAYFLRHGNEANS